MNTNNELHETELQLVEAEPEPETNEEKLRKLYEKMKRHEKMAEEKIQKKNKQ